MRRSHLIFAALIWLFGVSAANAKQTMTLAERTSNSFAIVQVDCEADGVTENCIIAGTHIFRTNIKPLGATQDPSKYCYVEVGISITSLNNVGGVFASQEGPGGMCLTQLISTIDYTNKKYTLRKFSEIRTGDFCAAQPDETHIYTNDVFMAPFESLHCNGFESIPTLWSP